MGPPFHRRFHPSAASAHPGRASQAGRRAPGEYIYSTRSLNAPVQNYAGIVGTDNQYAIDRGTKHVHAHVTGVAALAWQSSPSLTTAPKCGSVCGKRRILPRMAHSPEHHVGVREAERPARGAEHRRLDFGARPRDSRNPGPPDVRKQLGGLRGADLQLLLVGGRGEPVLPGRARNDVHRSTPGVYTVSLTATAGGLSGTIHGTSS